MKTRGLLIASLVVAAAMAGFAFYTASLLPEGAQLPTHFDASGNPDRFSGALTALLFQPGILMLMALLFAALPHIEPLQEKLEASASLLRVVWIGMMLLLVAIQLIVAAPVYGISVSPNLIPVAVGLLLIFVGNVLPKTRPGFFVGIRTPWAILDTDNWIATQRLGGKLMMLAGAAIIVAALVPLPPGLRAGLIIGAILAAVLPPFAYSWWLWNRKKSQGPRGS